LARDTQRLFALANLESKYEVFFTCAAWLLTSIATQYQATNASATWLKTSNLFAASIPVSHDFVRLQSFPE
jgi:hypothetical protein